jgi:Rieske Fe-S protein
MRKLHMLPSAETLCLSRRAALATLAAGAVGTLTACSSDSSPKQQTGTGATTDAGAADTGTTMAASCNPPVGTKQGAVTDFPVGTWKLVGDIIIAQDAMGLFALTGICSHIGCNLDPPLKDGTINCPCHGAQFDGNGNVLMGPAIRPLQHFALSICSGDVYVDKMTVVPQATRTAVA